MSGNILDMAAVGRTVLFDGALGTEIMRRGGSLERGAEILNIERPELIEAIHADYFAAGSDVVTTNSFGANRIKLAGYGLADRVRELNMAAVERAASRRPPGRSLAGSIGPTGGMLQPLGEYGEADLEESFREQAAALAEGGADLIIIETQFDLREALCALRAAGRACGLPVVVTMTYKRTPRGFFTVMGDDQARCNRALEKAGAAAVGANCTLTGPDMVELVKAARPTTDLPMIFQPNAGQPRMTADGRAEYDGDPAAFARDLVRMAESGASMVGGCCGTGPDDIRAARERLNG